MSKANAFILLAGDWLSRAVAVVAVIGGSFGIWKAIQAIRGDKLAQAQQENKSLRADVARLLREATVRIDNEQKYLEEIDGLQRKVTEQREQLNEWIDGKSTRQNPKSPNR